MYYIYYSFITAKASVSCLSKNIFTKIGKKLQICLSDKKKVSTFALAKRERLVTYWKFG